MTIKTLMLAGVALLATATSAHAISTVTYKSNVVPLTPTDFTSALSWSSSIPALGKLTGISVTLDGSILGNARAENLGGASNVTLTLSSTLTLKRPDHSTIVVTTPGIVENVSLGAFDGSVDFSGRSGVSFLGVTNSASNVVSLGAMDFGLFTGTGSVSGTLNGVGNSVATGSGNLTTFFQTQAGGSASVTYTYNSSSTVSTPEPAAIALLGLGMGVLGFTRRRAA